MNKQIAKNVFFLVRPTKCHYLTIFPFAGELQGKGYNVFFLWFNVSLGMINNFIKILRDRGLPVLYCRERQTYYYEYGVEVYLFVVKAKDDLRKIQGGEKNYIYFSPIQNFCIDPLHLCNKLINTEGQNDAGGFRFLGQ